jgi:hypothetical protein
MRIGDRVSHRINGFSGIITGRTEYINGCIQHLVSPEALDKDGKIMEGQWIDEQNLVIKTVGVLPDPFVKTGKATSGGPEGPSRRTS